jgi:hypothetical protein
LLQSDASLIAALRHNVEALRSISTAHISFGRAVVGVISSALEKT